MTPSEYYSITAIPTHADSSDGIRRIDKNSHFFDRYAVETFAKYFLREMHVGSLQFESTEHCTNRDSVPYVAYLFIHEATYIGACCFRTRELENLSTTWSMDWAWIHPFRRSQGHLSRAWPSLQIELGDFDVAEPTSKAMNAFLGKMAHRADTTQGKNK